MSSCSMCAVACYVYSAIFSSQGEAGTRGSSGDPGDPGLPVRTLQQYTSGERCEDACLHTI